MEYEVTWVVSIKKICMYNITHKGYTAIGHEKIYTKYINQVLIEIIDKYYRLGPIDPLV